MRNKITFLYIIIASLLLFSCKDQGTNGLAENNRKDSEINNSKNKSSITSKPLGTQLTSSDGTPLVNRVMSVSDPMRDPNWDWTQDKIDTLYITSYDDPKHIRRPYYGSGSVKPFFTGEDGTRDIWPEDGWELMLRDFGTSQYHVSTPFYILYNKHLGILRYIYFGNLVSDQITHATGTLSIKGSVRSPLFTLTDSTDQYLNDYNVYEQHTISKYYQDQWNVMDFRLAGFDPDIHTKYARFIIDVDAYQDFALNAGANLSLDGTLGSGGSTHSQFLSTALAGVDLYKNLSKEFKDIKTAQENYTEMLEYAENNSNAWWSGILATAATVGATSWIPALGPAVGVARFLLGGGSSQNRQPKPITLAGRMQLEGTISSTTDINQLEFIAPGAKVNNPDQAANYNELPLYNKKPGVFNLTDAPSVSATAFGDCISSSSGHQLNELNNLTTDPSSLIIQNEKPVPHTEAIPEPHRPPPGGSCETFIGYIKYHITSLDYVINRDIFKNNEQVEAAFTYHDKEATEYMDVTDGSAVVNVQFNDLATWNTWVTVWKAYFKGVGISAQLPLKDVPSSVTPVSILKSYNPDYGEMENLGISYY